MYVIIVGCSPAGYHLSKGLLASGNEVIVIDKNRHKCQLLYDELGSIAIHGDGTDQKVLEAAGAARSDILFATTTTDQTNLIACQIAKQTFNVPRTAATVTDTKNETLFQILGVDLVVNTTHTIVTQLEAGVTDQRLIHLADLDIPSTELVKIHIPDDAWSVGKRLTDIPMPDHSFISLVIKGEILAISSPNLMIDAHDEIIAVTHPEEEHMLYETLTGVSV